MRTQHFTFHRKKEGRSIKISKELFYFNASAQIKKESLVLKQKYNSTLSELEVLTLVLELMLLQKSSTKFQQFCEEGQVASIMYSILKVLLLHVVPSSTLFSCIIINKSKNVVCKQKYKSTFSVPEVLRFVLKLVYLQKSKYNVQVLS